jgi:hypothetical protein
MDNGQQVTWVWLRQDSEYCIRYMKTAQLGHNSIDARDVNQGSDTLQAVQVVHPAAMPWQRIGQRITAVGLNWVGVHGGSCRCWQYTSLQDVEHWIGRGGGEAAGDVAQGVAVGSPTHLSRRVPRFF